MFSRFHGVWFLMIALLLCSTAAFAGKVELTTYYPAPYGEYKELKSTENASFATSSGRVGIGTTTPAGILDVTSTTSGFLPPRMTTAQRSAIASPSEGMVIFNRDTNQLEIYSGTGWTSAAGSAPTGAVMAFNLDACPSGWLLADGTNGTPDLRGVFVRGLDSGKGIDPSRTLATFQDYATASPQRGTAPDTTVSGYSYSSPHRYGFARRTNAGENRTTTGPDTVDSGTQPDIVSWSTGDSETRPKNVALLYCIKS